MDFRNCINCNSSSEVEECDSSKDFNIHCRTMVSDAFQTALLFQNINIEHTENLRLCFRCSEPLNVFCNSRNLFLKLSNTNSKLYRLLNHDSCTNDESEVANNEAINSKITKIKQETEESILPDQGNSYDHNNSCSTNDIIKQEPGIIEYQERFIKLELDKLPEEAIAKFSKQNYLNLDSANNKEDSSFYKCFECARIFSESEQLEKHKHSVHTTIQPNFRCTFCPKVFRMTWFLKNHLNACHNGIEILHYCQKCGKKFYNEKDLEEHVLKIHDVRKYGYKCRNCFESFETIHELRTHLLKNHKGTKEADAAEGNIKTLAERQLKNKKCNICEEIFGSFASLCKHMKSDHNQKEKFNCGICSSEFLSCKKLRQHKQIHKSCPICDKQFLNYYRMNIHYSRVHGPVVDLPFVCELCGQRCSGTDRLLHHYKWHVEVSGPKRFCYICNKAFKTKAHLSQHMKNKHSENKSKHSCPFCDVVFTAKSSVYIHIGQKHKEQLKFPCKICGKKFLNMDSVGSHSRVHTRETAFESKKNKNRCKNMEKVSNVSHGKLEVMACYSSETFLFTCPLCGKSCDSQTHFYRHLRMLHSLKGYADPNAKVSSTINCPMCDKVFARKDLLDRHRRRAHNITNKFPGVAVVPRSYECPHCGKIISDCTFQVFMAHVSRHEIFIIEDAINNPTHKKELSEFYNENDKQFKCTVCKQTFSLQYEFLNHWTKNKHSISKIIHDYEKKSKINFAFKCEECPGIQYPTLELLRRHKETHRFRKDRIRKCNICNQILRSPKYLRIHMRTKH